MCTPEDVANCEAHGGCPLHGTGIGSCPPGIVIGKQNSPEKPCKFCGSTDGCDCPIEIYSVSPCMKQPICVAFYDTIRKLVKGEKWIIKWECNALGFHEREFDTEKEADEFMEKLKAVSLAWNCGEIVLEVNQ